MNPADCGSLSRRRSQNRLFASFGCAMLQGLGEGPVNPAVMP